MSNPQILQKVVEFVVYNHLNRVEQDRLRGAQSPETLEQFIQRLTSDILKFEEFR